MQLILLENIINLGNIGDKVEVKDGYGRNFLLRYGKALRFNKENLELVKKKKDELNKKNIETKNKFKDLAKLVNKKIFTSFFTFFYTFYNNIIKNFIYNVIC